jgi:DNA-binding Lrp family transcriptional regulator
MPNVVRRIMEFVELDALDRALLRELQHDARQTNRELATRTGVSPSTSLERVRLLRERGLITGFHAELDLQAAGRSVQALISVRVRPPARPVIEGFREWAAQLPETIGLFVISGSHDFLIHVAVPDVDSVYAFVIDRLTERREVADVQTTLVFEHVQSHIIDPAPAERPQGSRRRNR